MKSRKFTLVSILGATVFFLFFSLIIAAISGDVRENFLKIATLMFILFLAPVYILPIISIFVYTLNAYVFTNCFYYVGLVLIAFTHKVIGPVQSINQVAICFLVSFLTCYIANKIIVLQKEINELKDYKKAAEPYMSFLEKKADKCGMTMYDYLEMCKKFEENEQERQ